MADPRAAPLVRRDRLTYSKRGSSTEEGRHMAKTIEIEYCTS